jgi:hypothetical protein
MVADTCIFVIRALRKQENQEFLVSLSYLARPCLKKQTQL